MLNMADQSWTFRLARIAGIEVLIHWTLPLIAIFECLRYAQSGAPAWLIPLPILVLFVSVLLHEFGHSLTARAVGGDSRRIIMWALGGLAECQVPMRWRARLAVAAGGPLVTAVLVAAAGAFCVFDPSSVFFWFRGHGDITSGLLAMVANLNLILLLFNLIPAHPLDGGAILRALLWPLVGLRRAVLYTIHVAYVLLALLLVLALMQSQIFLGLIVVFLGMNVWNEHRALKMGYDAYGGGAIASASSEAGLLARWRRNRAAKQSAAASARQQQRHQELDRLLEKVSQHGLPSLSKAERRYLQRYSQEQRQED